MVLTKHFRAVAILELRVWPDSILDAPHVLLFAYRWDNLLVVGTDIPHPVFIQVVLTGDCSSAPPIVLAHRGAK